MTSRSDRQACPHYELRRYVDDDGTVSWFCVEPQCDFEIPAATIATPGATSIGEPSIPSEGSRPRELLEQLAQLLASAWRHGDWKAETANEREMQAIMERLGFWPAADTECPRQERGKSAPCSNPNPDLCCGGGYNAACDCQCHRPSNLNLANAAILKIESVLSVTSGAPRIEMDETWWKALCAVYRERLAVETSTLQPTAWRRWIDSDYEKSRRWIYTGQAPTIAPDKWEPLYGRPTTQSPKCPSCDAGVPRVKGDLHADSKLNASWPCELRQSPEEPTVDRTGGDPECFGSAGAPRSEEEYRARVGLPPKVGGEHD